MGFFAKLFKKKSPEPEFTPLPFVELVIKCDLSPADPTVAFNVRFPAGLADEIKRRLLSQLAGSIVVLEQGALDARIEAAVASYDKYYGSVLMGCLRLHRATAVQMRAKPLSNEPAISPLRPFFYQ